MIQDCQKQYLPNFKRSCCLKHLIILNSVSEINLLEHNYGKFLLKTLNNLYKEKSEKLFIEINLENSVKFLNIITKYISHYYFLEKLAFSKFLCKFGIKFTDSSLYREHPDMILRLYAIRNNLASIHEKEKKYEKSLNELDLCKKYLNSNYDKIIFYNNYIRVYNQIKNKNVSQIKSYLNLWKECIIEEINNMKNKNLFYSDKNIDKNIINLISFTCYNYALFKEKEENNINEAKEFYKKGYEFSICLLGDENHLTLKYQNKINLLSSNQTNRNYKYSSSESENEKNILNNLNEDSIDSDSNFDNKLGKILYRLENIGQKFQGKNIKEEDKKFLIEQTKEIKNMIKKKKNITTTTDNSNSNDEKKEDSDLKNSKKNIDSQINKIYFNDISPKELKENLLNNTNLLDDDSESPKEKKEEFSFKKTILGISLEDKKNNEKELNIKENKNDKKEKSSGYLKFTKAFSKIIPKISIINTEEQVYKPETFFQTINDRPPQVSITLNNDNNDDYVCKTFYVSSSHNNLNEGFYISEFIDDECKISTEMINVKKEEFDVIQFFNQLNKNNINVKKKIIGIRYIKDIKYFIQLEPNEEGINILLLKQKNLEQISKISFDYSKLESFISKILLYISIETFQIFSYTKTIEEFSRNLLVNYISCRNQDSNFKFGISQNPIGIFMQKSINLKIRHIMCVFDLFILSKEKVRIILYSTTNESNIIFIDALFDSISFNLIFEEEKEFKGIFKLKNEDYTSDNNIINIGKNIQKCLNAFCNNKYNTFDDLAQSKKTIVTFHCEINNECNDMILKGSEFSERLFKITQFDNDLNKNDGIIYSCDIKDLFGYDVSELFLKTNFYEKICISQFLINSIYINNENKKVTLYESKVINYYNTVYCDKICNFALTKINNHYFIKFMIYNPIVAQEFIKILLIKSDKIREKLQLEDYDKIFKKNILNSVQNFKKGQSAYLEVLEL